VRKAKQTAVNNIRALEQTFVANQEQERLRKEQADAQAAGDGDRIAQAEATAAEERKARVAALVAQMKAEEEAEAQRQENERLVAASQERAQQLEDTAANTVAEEVKPELVNVAGMSRATVYKWRLKDRRKLKDEFLLVDEKGISKIVTAMKEKAASIVGDGAIEVYQDSNIRQR
jgi:hypothetical protein